MPPNDSAPTAATIPERGAPTPPTVLIVNQHGDNRGDEAALKAMLGGFAERLGAVRFVLVHQFRDPELPIRYGHEVEAHSMYLPLVDGAGLVLYALARWLGLAPRWLLGRRTRPIVDAYRRAALVVSAPGGPYFGDVYRGHELVHWLYVWLGKLHGKPLFLYAPSAGPFRTPVLNALRRRFFAAFDRVAVRESISAGHLRQLCGAGFQLEVTADSALQQAFEAASPRRFFGERSGEIEGRLLVAMTAIQYRYPGCSDAAARRAGYDETVLEAMVHLAGRRRCHVLLFPQLYGAANSDAAYLENLGRRFPAELSWEVVDPALDADEHQRLIAMAELSIASRYHPQIFAAAGATPGVCIYYEHKALSFMEALGLERLAFDIRTLRAAELCAGLDEALERSEEIAAQLRARIGKLRERSRRTTDLAVALLREGGRP